VNAGPLLLIAAAGLAAGLLGGYRLRVAWLIVTLMGTTAAALAAGKVLLSGVPWEWLGFRLGGETIHLRLDGVSAFFLVLLAVLGASGSLYSHEYWHDRDYPRSAPRGRMWWSGFLLSMGLVLLSANGLHFLIAWELFAVSSYFLITLDRQRRDVRAAGWLYLAASHAGTLCLFAFFSALASHTGSWELVPLREHTELTPLFWLALAGFGVKAGVFPLHIWLPSAHANAPSHVSAVMSGVAIKIGIYGLVRFSGFLPVPPAASWVIIGIGAVTALLGITFAFVQNDLKRLLAYSSVENIGIILVGLGGGLLGLTQGDTAWGRLAFAGALLHVWNHGLFKALLFFGAGSVLHATGTREMSRLGGLWRAMPWTAALFAVGALAVAALPPLNGFVSEWLVYLGLFDTVTSHTSAAWIAMPAAIMLGVTGALALATFTKAAATIFLGAPRTAVARRAHESGWTMRLAMIAVATLCFAIALAPLAFWPGIRTAMNTWRPMQIEAVVTAPLAAIGPVQITLAALLVIGVTGLIWNVRRRSLRRSLTWDCGYAAPSARMQYTSGSFATIAGGWFGWILQPERSWRRPRGFFPVDAIRLERTPETVLDRVIAPAARVILQLSNAARRLQHGRLQYYVAYVVVGLAALATLVVWGGIS
jgi:hydrogenase-4 component B